MDELIGLSCFEIGLRNQLKNASIEQDNVLIYRNDGQATKI